MSSEESSIKSISSPPDFSGMTPPNHTVEGVKCLRNELTVSTQCCITLFLSVSKLNLMIFYLSF